jgi:hypothetical protein
MSLFSGSPSTPPTWYQPTLTELTALPIQDRLRDGAGGRQLREAEQCRDRRARPACGGDIRLIAFITEPGPIRKILTHLGEPLEPPPVSPARGPPTDWDELVQAHDERVPVALAADSSQAAANSSLNEPDSSQPVPDSSIKTRFVRFRVGVCRRGWSA